MDKAKILFICIITRFPSSIYGQNSTEVPALTAETRQPKLVTEVGTARTQTWEPYATLNSGSQIFYSPPDYGKRIVKPIEAPDPEDRGSFFNQKFSGFSNKKPPRITTYEELEEPRDLYESVDRYRFSSLPPHRYSSPTPLHEDYEPIRLPSNFKSSAFGSLMTGGEEDIPDDLYNYVHRNRFSSLPPYRYSSPTPLNDEDFEPIRLPSNFKSSAFGSLVTNGQGNVPEGLYDSVDRERFSSLPPYRYSSPTPLNEDFEPFRLPSNFKSSAFGSLVTNGKDDIPTYIEPVLTPQPGEEINGPTGDVYNLFVYNDMSSTEGPEEHKINQNRRPPKYLQHLNKFNPDVDSSPLQPIRNPYFSDNRGAFQNENPHAVKKFKDHRRRPFKRRRKRPPHHRFRRRRKHRFRSYRPRPIPPPPPPHRGPPKIYQEEPEEESYSMMNKVGPIAALATLLPVGLLLSTIAPTFLGKRKKRSAAENWNPTFDIIEKYGSEKLEDMICLQRIFCEVMIQENISKTNVAIELITYILAKMKTHKKESLGLKSVSTCIDKKDCSAFQCKPISKNR